MATYRVLLHVASATLPTLLSLIEGTGIRLVNVSDVNEPEPLPPSPPRPPIEVGKKEKDIRGADLIVETLASGPATLAELRQVFTNRSFAASSTASCVSHLLKEKRIERRPHGRYALSPNGRAVS